MGGVNASAYDARGRRKYLTRSECQKFLAATRTLSDQRAAFCLTIYYTGCRISEALNLTGEDIDSEESAIVFRCLKKRGKVEIRRLPIPEQLTKKLRKIGTSTGNKRIWNFSRSTGWRTIKTVMTEACIFGVHASPKGLRHGFGVRSVLQKIPLTLIRDWMGHSNISTTAIYLDVKGEEERELIRKTW